VSQEKVYVRVRADFDRDGSLTPLFIEWEDGHVYQIDQILDVRRRSSLKAGGSGMRYLVRIGRSRTQLFYENPAWFVERK